MPYEVTIGLPVYNVEKYIRTTLESALAQTFQSIEILVCDDCGTDSSMDIIREYQQTHPRGKDIRILRQPHNKGIGEGRNLLVSQARSKYIYFMDADDTIPPNAIEVMYEAARKHDAQLVFGSYERIELFNNGATSDFKYPHLVFTQENEFALWAYRKYEGILAMTCNILIDVSIYMDNDLKYKPINYWEDFSFTINLPIYVTRAVLLPDITYYYYCHVGSLSNYQKRDHINKSEIMDTIQAIEEVKATCSLVEGKPFAPLWLLKVMNTCFYIDCNILKKKKITTPAFTKREIRDVMRSPFSFRKIMSFRKKRAKNLAAWMLGVLPPFMSVAIIKLLGKLKGLV